MGYNVDAIDLMVESRKRMVAGIMNHCEKSAWWPRLRPEEQKALRSKILDSAGVFSDTCRDIVKVGVGNDLINDEAIQLLRDLSAKV